MSRATIILLLLVCFGCKDPVGQENTSFNYDLKGLIDLQVRTFIQNNTSLNKTVILDGKEEKTVYTPDSSEWINELNLLLSIDINKPIYQGLYTKTERKDTESNLIIATFQHVNIESAKIPFVEIYYLDDINLPKQVKGEFREKSAVSDSYRMIQLSFEQSKGSNTLTSYSLEGYQKLRGIDSVNFNISSILY